MDMGHDPTATPTGKDLKALVVEILDDNRTMAIGTLRPDGWPQVTTVGYVHDDLTIFFVVARDSQKLANLRRDPRVSIAIGHHGHDEMAVRGLSMAARVEEVTEPDEIRRLNTMIWQRYPNIAVFAPREVNSAVLRARPHLISVVDDTRGLATPAAFEVSAQVDLATLQAAS